MDDFHKTQVPSVYGGVAGMDTVEEADKYAYRRGLFVLGMAGEGVVRIMNDRKFRPKDFAAQKGDFLTFQTFPQAGRRQLQG